MRPAKLDIIEINGLSKVLYISDDDAVYSIWQASIDGQRSPTCNDDIIIAGLKIILWQEGSVLFE